MRLLVVAQPEVRLLGLAQDVRERVLRLEQDGCADLLDVVDDVRLAEEARGVGVTRPGRPLLRLGIGRSYCFNAIGVDGVFLREHAHLFGEVWKSSHTYLPTRVLSFSFDPRLEPNSKLNASRRQRPHTPPRLTSCTSSAVNTASLIVSG